MQTQTMPRRWSSVADTADYYGVTTKTIKRWIQDGRITAHRFGPRLLRIDLAQADAELMGGAA